MDLVNHKHAWYEKILNLFSHVRPGEGKSCLLLTFNAALIMACFYLLKVVRDPLVLSEGGAELKSYATALQAALLIIIVPLFSAFYIKHAHKQSRSFFINRLSLFFTSHLLIFAMLNLADINIGVSFYVWLGIFSVMLLAQFWAFVADTFNVKSGQRLFVIIAVGAALGSFVGAFISGYLLDFVGISGIMVFAALLLITMLLSTSKAVAWVPLHARNEQSASNEAVSNQWLEGFRVVFNHQYLVLIALFVVILNFANSTGEYILARFVIDHTEAILQQGTSRYSLEVLQGQFYSKYNAWITALSFAIQLLIVSRLFKCLGIKGAILILPSVMILSYGLILFLPIFSIVKLAMISEKSISYSVQNTIQQVLFLPVNRKQKYLGKMTIDTFFFRFGDLIYGATIYFGIQFLQLELSHFIIINIACAVLLLLLALRIGYYNQIEVQNNLGNSAPQQSRHLPKLSIPSGLTSEFTISEHTFTDPDIGDALKFYASLDNGHPLPKWIVFDRYTRTFSFSPPNDHQGQQKIKISAVDYEGLSVVAYLTVNFEADN